MVIMRNHVKSRFFKGLRKKWYYVFHFEFLPFPTQMTFQFNILCNGNSTAFFYQKGQTAFLIQIIVAGNLKWASQYHFLLTFLKNLHFNSQLSTNHYYLVQRKWDIISLPLIGQKNMTTHDCAVELSIQVGKQFNRTR